MFKKLNKKKSFPEIEKEILKFWEVNDTFNKTLEATKDKKPFVFYDGPPFATGLPHYGHLLAGTLKDIVPRYWTMRGRYVERRFGWDCHGLPIEKLAQDELNLKGTPEILEKGVDVFNEQCRSMVLKYADAWRKTVTRMGRWVDFDNDYKTMDVTFMESVWWVFKQIWDKKRVYKAHRVMPYSWALTTPLSNFEANSNYKDVQDPAITVRFKLKEENAYLLAWTTTPWTLISNLALCAGPEIDYIKIKDNASGEFYYLAEARLSTYYKKEEDYEIVGKLLGKDLLGKSYEPLFPYFKDNANSFIILNDKFVTISDGTGIVHMAPAYGEDDYRICGKSKISLVDPLDVEAKFTDIVPEYKTLFCKDADKQIIRRLKDEGKLIHQSTIMHSYPYCDRSDTPLIYRAIEAWYIKVEDMRDDLVKNNEMIHWTPEYVGTKRFGNWLKDAKDWNISRNRFWGSCIPIWECESCGEFHCIGSIEELEKLSGEKVTDLHKHFIDPITIKCTKDGCYGTMTRIPEVFDCWFESGSMPYSQSHYPFNNKEKFEAAFPADFIAEGLDQTRGWFYTLLVLSTILFDKPAIKNVVVNGLILAEDGKKMSKRLQNYPAPELVMDKYGADALRMYLINSPVVRAEDLKFSEAGVKDMLKAVIIPFWNSYNFFVEYAITDNWDPSKDFINKSTNELDKWILSVLQSLVKEVNLQMEDYNLFKVVPSLVGFIEDLTNWYIRRSRARFWSNADENKEEKKECHSTLYTVLVTFTKMVAPILPLLSEDIFQNIVASFSTKESDSVHLSSYPEVQEEFIDLDLEKRMQIVRTVVGLGNALRARHNLKNRQPLLAINVVVSKGDKEIVKEYSSLIMDELNIKNIEWIEDESSLVTISAKANFKTLGRKLGKRMKEFAGLISKLTVKQIKDMQSGDSIIINGESFIFEDIIVERTEKENMVVETINGITVALTTEITPELITEGMALEVKTRINNLRKEAGFDKEDQIQVAFSTESKELKELILGEWNTFIKKETLTIELIEGNGNGGFVGESKVYDKDIKIIIEKK